MDSYCSWESTLTGSNTGGISYSTVHIAMATQDLSTASSVNYYGDLPKKTSSIRSAVRSMLIWYWARASMFHHVWFGFTSFSDPDSPSDGGDPLAQLLPGGGTFLSPSARGLFPGCSSPAEEDLGLVAQAGQFGPAYGVDHTVPAAASASGLLSPAGRQRRIPALSEKVRDFPIIYTWLRSFGPRRLICFSGSC